MRHLLAALLLAALPLGGCSSSPAKTGPAEPRAAARGPIISFAYESLDERPVSLEGLRGRAVVVAFLASYGDASLVQARYLRKVFREHSPRINAAAVFMEGIDNRPLVRVFRDAAGLPFPVAMADAATIAGKGPFEGINTVPSVVVLDPEGREVWRKVGVGSPEELDKALREAQRSVWGGPADEPRAPATP
jgi:peroxiredoxin